ncbi:MAG: glutamate--tRNA ligase [Deltaproteobacteria bacterium]|nr:MAG: glutamate--tRNA ligase [Deltaproteobacteria bacterium]
MRVNTGSADRCRRGAGFVDPLARAWFIASVKRVRTRFAPSPTGHLHLGGARTALFNYLFARHHAGTFVLRIEDTDRQRSRPEFVDAILEGLDWLGLDYDEGPVFQSERGDLYRRKVEELLAGGHAYYCFCPPERLEKMRVRAQAEGRRAVYDRSCRSLGRAPRAGEKAVVRFKMPTDGHTAIRDLVRGPVVFENTELDDLILVRSDGTPTFHLVVVVDDVEMGITHVLRGEDHLTNTPKQIQICRALGAEPPVYGHLPLIVGADRSRLSKRHGATSVAAYREQGFVSEAVVNYLARLGWSHGDQEIFTREELIRLFDVDGVGKAAAAFDMDKFTWVNFEHMKRLPDEVLARRAAPFVAGRTGLSEQEAERALTGVVPILRERSKTLVELSDQAAVFVSDDVAYDARAVDKFLGPDARERLLDLCDRLERVADWRAEEIRGAFEETMARYEIKLGKLAQPARVALTGGTVSPGIFEVCEVLGRERTLSRLRAACEGAAAGTLPLREVEAAGAG